MARAQRVRIVEGRHRGTVPEVASQAEIAVLIRCRNEAATIARVVEDFHVTPFPALAAGFESGTELTVHARALRMPNAAIVTADGERPEGSTSKLRSLHDGTRASHRPIARRIRAAPRLTRERSADPT